MRHFRHANAKSQRPQRAMGRGMAITAYQQHARLAQASLRADDMHNALLAISQAEMLDPMFRGIAFQRFDHAAIFRIGDVFGLARIGGDIMIRRCENPLRRTRRDAALAQHFKGRRGAVMDEVTINIKQNLTIFAFQDAVAHPDLVEHGQGFRCGVLHHARDHSGRTRLWQARRLPHFHLAPAGRVGYEPSLIAQAQQQASGQQQHGRDKNRDKHRPGGIGG